MSTLRDKVITDFMQAPQFLPKFFFFYIVKYKLPNVLTSVAE